MPFSLAKELAQTTHQTAPNCTFVAFPAERSHVFNSKNGTENICWNNESKTYAKIVSPSSGSNVGDSPLKEVMEPILLKRGFVEIMNCK